VLRGADLLRASSYHETIGLDMTEIGVAGYNDDGSINQDATEPTHNQLSDPWGVPTRGITPYQEPGTSSASAASSAQTDATPSTPATPSTAKTS
jgi:hypothetical protein